MKRTNDLALREIARLVLIIEEEEGSADGEFALRRLAAVAKHAANEMQHIRHYGIPSTQRAAWLKKEGDL